MSLEINAAAVASIKRTGRHTIESHNRPHNYRDRPAVEIPSLTKASSGSSSSHSSPSPNRANQRPKTTHHHISTSHHNTIPRHGTANYLPPPKSPSRSKKVKNRNLNSPAEIRRMRSNRRRKRIEKAVSQSPAALYSHNTHRFHSHDSLSQASEDSSIIRGAQILRQQLMLEEAAGLPDNTDYSHNDEHFEAYPDDAEAALLRGYNHDKNTNADLLSRAEMVTRALKDAEEQTDQQHLLHDSGDVSSSDDWSDPWNLPMTSPRAIPLSTDGSSPSYNFQDFDGAYDDIEQEPAARINLHDPWPDIAHGDSKTSFTFPTKGDASEWAELSSEGSKEDPDGFYEGDAQELFHPPPRNDYRYRVNEPETTAFSSPSNTSPETTDDDDFRNNDAFFDNHEHLMPPPAPADGLAQDGTPETTMGRNRNLRTKVQTYLVQRVDELETDSSTLPSSYFTNTSSLTSPTNFPSSLSSPTQQDLQRRASPQEQSSYLPNALLTPPKARPDGMDDPMVTRVNGRNLLNNNSNNNRPKLATTTSPRHAELKEAAVLAVAAESHSDSLHLLQDLRHDEDALYHDLQSEERRSEISYFLAVGKDDPNVFMRTQRPTATPIVTPPRNVEQSLTPPTTHVVSPMADQYNKLAKDPAYCHAQRAGQLWQSLVSQHVRFPSSWWNGARSPPLGLGDRQLWNYMGRHRVVDNSVLNGLVHNRGSAGRLLLHIVVRDLMTHAPVQDIAIGCFHPNARGIRTTEAFSPMVENCRDVWLAVRRRTGECSVIETMIHHSNNLTNVSISSEESSELPNTADHSPLGEKHAVHNNNMRAVFGETPPIQTMFVMENEIYELLSGHVNETMPPALVLMEEFLHQKF